MVEIPQIRDFLSWSIQKILRKVKQFLRKCYITRLIDLANKLFDQGLFQTLLLYFKHYIVSNTFILHLFQTF